MLSTLRSTPSMGVGPSHRAGQCLVALQRGSLEVVKSLANAGVGVGILPARVAQHGRSGLILLGALLPTAVDVIRLIYRGDLHRTRAAMRLERILRRRCGEARALGAVAVEPLTFTFTFTGARQPKLANPPPPSSAHPSSPAPDRAAASPST